MADALPFLLAGPVLRRVEARLVTVWVACSEAATVGLSVWSQAIDAGAGTGLAAIPTPPTYTTPAPVATVKAGDKLHVLAVTLAIPETATAMNPVTVYSYNVTFTAASGQQDLKSLGLLRAANAPRPTLPLGYQEGFLPSFILPGTTTEAVHLAHGSCRKPHGPGRDGLAVLDQVLEDFIVTRQEPLKRPQQLFLTGDQVYADDVAVALLRSLNPLANDLIGKPETVNLKASAPPVNAEVTLAKIPAFSRQKLVKETAKFTSESAGSHLLSFGEFCAMYVLAWSNRAWPEALMNLTATIADSELDFINNYAPDPALAGFLTALPEAAADQEKQKAAWRRQYRGEVEQLLTFRDALPRVQRVLANIPAYMILDDHEITDDWYLTKRWRQQVLTTPLGVSILRNGLLAYALFQDWGNSPKAYTEAGNKKKRLLELIPLVFNSQNATLPKAGAELDEVHQLLGLNTEAAPPVKWHYRVPTGPLTTFVLDTRTRRAYDRALSPPGLLTDEAFNEQLATPEALQNPEAVLVVSAAPVLGMAVFEELIQPLYWGAAEGRPAPDFEAWAFHPPTFEKLLAKLVAFNKAIILSGDVHFSSSVTLDYWKKNGATYSPARVVQLVSSSFKNQTDLVSEAFFVSGRINQLESAAFFPSRRLGWNSKPTVNGPLTSRNKIRLRKTPVMLSPGKAWTATTTITPTPDWAWQCQPVMDERPENQRPPNIRIEPLATDNVTADPQSFYEQVMKRHMEAFKKYAGRSYVWLNNVGLVAFSRNGTDLRVEHTLWHFLATDEDGAKPQAYTFYSLSLTPTTEPVPSIP